MVKKKIYIISAFLTLLIILSTLGVSFIIDSLRRDYIKDEIVSFKKDMEVLNIETMIIDSVGDVVSCSKIEKPLFFVFFSKLWEIENKIKFYEESDSLLVSDEAMALKDDYILTSLRSWITLQKLQEKCGGRFVNILYIYDIEDCEDCNKQGLVLSYYKELLGEKFMVFAVDGGFENGALTLIEDIYDYESAPMLIINGLPYKNFIEKDEIKTIVCNELNETLTGNLCSS